MARGGMSDRRVKMRADYLTIDKEVRALLRGHPEHVEARRKKAAAVVAGLERWRGALADANNRRPKRTRGVVLSITQGAWINAGVNITANVEVNGRGVGTLVFHANGEVPIFTTREGARLVWSNPTGDRGHAQDAQRIRAYLDKESERPLVPERTTQGRLVRSFFEGKKHELLRQLKPVAPDGFMMEMPAPVSASGPLKVGTGNIDLLLHAGQGRNARFVVCELKKPGAAIDPYVALRQAICYAAALDVEVNGIEGAIAPADRSLYRKLFGTTGESKLRFGVLAAIDEKNEAGVAKAFEVLAPPPRPSAWVEVLLYREAKNVAARQSRKVAECVLTPVKRLSPFDNA